MVKKYIFFKTSLFLIFLFLFLLLPKSAYGSFDVDLTQKKADLKTDQVSDLITFQPTTDENLIKRYIVFGSDSVSKIISRANQVIYGVDSDHGSLVIGLFSQDEVYSLKQNGYNVIEDLPLEFDSLKSDPAIGEASRIDKIMGSDKVAHNYGYTGDGIRIGIVDTGTDFSNPDVKDALARDKYNIPVMLDADGQGIVLTNATFVADINNKGIIQNYTKKFQKMQPLPFM